MALDPAANFVRDTTTAALDNTQTTVSVADATIFPDPSTEGEYNVVVWDVDSFPRPDQDPSVEVLRVTARDTGLDELTVSRGQEGTSGASHPSGSAVHLSPTAKMFSDIQTKTSGLSDDGTSLDIEQININDYSAVLEKTTDQAISANTDTTVEWDSQTVDTDLYSYDASTDALEVLASGDYRVNVVINWTGLSDQDLLQIKIRVNGVSRKSAVPRASGSGNQPSEFNPLLKGLSANDTISIQVRTDDTNTVQGIGDFTFADITKEA